MSGAPFRPYRHAGELTMRYFFALRETVYTVNIATPAGIVESIASIYPLAAQCERELQPRLEVIFQGAAPATPSAMPYSEFGAVPHAAFRIPHSIEPASDLLGWAGRIASAEVDPGYNYVGLEERVADGGLDWAQAMSVVEKLCGRCSQANLLAFVQAAEAMSLVIVPPRAAILRLMLAESERIVSHLLNAADTMEALGLHDRAYTLRDLRERVIQAIAEWSGARIQPGLIVYGGVMRNMDEGQIRNVTLAMRHVERVLRGAVTSTINSKEIAARLVGLGTIRGQEAVVGGLRGPVLRASGAAVDVRAAFPTGAYEDESVTIVVQRNGDAFSRLVVRLLECLESFRVIEQVLDDMPPGPVKPRGNLEMRGGSGVSRVEGPRGEVFCWVKGSPEGLSSLHISAGSFPVLNVLPGLLRDQWREDLQLILLSVDLCLPCAER
jgi:Ni,Fe-hydrogenase III large subunit